MLENTNSIVQFNTLAPYIIIDTRLTSYIRVLTQDNDAKPCYSMTALTR